MEIIITIFFNFIYFLLYMKVIAGMPWRLDWDFSGLSKHLEAYFNAISDTGVDVNLYCLGPENKKTKFSISNIPVKSIPNGGIFAPLFNSIAFSYEFAKAISEEEYNILHCFNTTTLFLTGRKYIFQTTNPTYAFALDAVKDEYPKNVKYKRFFKYYASV
ncbi:MAG: hypothetical protein ACFFDN_52295, partial [Candidatus Hodarchaeota archaeon]